MGVVYSMILPRMECDWTGYMNNYDGHVSWGTQDAFLAGQKSYHSNHYEDRRYNWKYCRLSDGNKYGISNIQSGPSETIGFTTLDMEFSRGCGGNTALRYVKSMHDNDNEDRTFRFRCAALHNKLRLVECDWTSGYVADYDDDINYQCPNNGIIRTVSSIHSNRKEDRKWKFECCRVSISEISNEKVLMNCFEDTHYVNNNDGSFDFTKNSYFLNGIDSFHDNDSEDRRFKFRYCKPLESTYPYYGTNTLPTTEYDAEWTRSCFDYNNGHSGIVGIKSQHSNNKEDRKYTIKCGNLDTSRYGLAQCGWTGDLNSYDKDATFNCLKNGIIRSIWSKHSNHFEDRIFRFECCNIFSNKFSNVVGSWQNVLSCGGCPQVEHKVSIGISKENSETTSQEYRNELTMAIKAGYTYNAPSATGGVGTYGEVSISNTQAQTTANSLTSVLSESVVVTNTILCDKTYLFQWVQSANDYIVNVGNNDVYVFSGTFLCTNNPYPMCPLGFCKNETCNQCLNGYTIP